MRVYCLRNQQLLVAVNLGLNVARGNQLGQFSLDLFNRDVESSRDVSHVKHFVGRHILLQILGPNLVVNVFVAEEVVHLKFVFNLGERALQLLETAVQEVVEDLGRLRVALEQGEHRGARQEIVLDFESRHVA